jgi:uroporphyrinogen decarboxylase
VPLCDLTFWPETLETWHRAGFPAGADPVDHFGLDRIVCINDLFEPSFGLAPRIVEETADHRVTTDGYGKTVKTFLTSYNPPVTLDHAIHSREDWLRLRPRLVACDEKFNNPAAEAEYHAARAAGHFLAITPAEPMWFVINNAMRYDDGLLAVAAEPDLVLDMLTAYTDYLVAMLERTFARGFAFDAIWFWSDLCYRNGMLFSPAFAREHLLPRWARLADLAHDRGMRLMFHCDGNVSDLLPLLVEAGCDAIHPLEVRAGNDVRVYKKRFGQAICFIGNIDADIVAAGDREGIEAEVAAKVPAAAAGGGYIYHIDHSVPPTVTLDAYRFLLECVRRHAR